MAKAPETTTALADESPAMVAPTPGLFRYSCKMLTKRPIPHPEAIVEVKTDSDQAAYEAFVRLNESGESRHEIEIKKVA